MTSVSNGRFRRRAFCFVHRFPQLAHGDHAVVLRIPELQLKTPDDFKRMPRRSWSVMQFWHVQHGFLKTIKRNTGVYVVNMMVPDIACDPLHHWIHYHMARRRQSRVYVGPVVILPELSARKIMLTVEQV